MSMWPQNTSDACNQWIISPTTVACSGHGYCSLVTNECVCDDGWSGEGEFINRSGRDCNVSHQGVIIIHIIGIITGIMAMMVAFRSNAHALRAARRQRGRGDVESAGGNISVNTTGTTGVDIHVKRPSRLSQMASSMCCPPWLHVLVNDPASRVAIFIHGISISGIACNIIRLSSPTDSHMFQNWSSNIASILTSTLFWSSTASYAWGLVKQSTLAISHARGHNGAKASLERMRRLIYGTPIIGIVGATFLIWTRLATTYESQENSMIALYGMFTIAGAWLQGAISYHSYRIVQQIDALRDAKLHFMRQRLVWAVTFLTFASASDIVVTGALAFWPWLRTQSAYMTPVVVIFVHLIDIVAQQIFAAQTRATAAATTTTRPIGPIINTYMLRRSPYAKSPSVTTRTHDAFRTVPHSSNQSFHVGGVRSADVSSLGVTAIDPSLQTLPMRTATDTVASPTPASPTSVNTLMNIPPKAAAVITPHDHSINMVILSNTHGGGVPAPLIS